MSNPPTPLFELAWVSLATGFIAFIGASTVFSSLNLALGIAVGLVTLGAATFIALAVTGHDWRHVTGLSRFSARDIALGAVLGLANSISLSAWLGELSLKVLPQFVLELFDTSRILASAMTNRIEQAVVLLAVVVLAPLAEEFFFRGVLFHGLNRRFGMLTSAVVSGVVFSAYHLDPVGFLPRVEIGIVLGLLVAKTGSLWPAIAAHAANNALASVLLVAKVPDAELPIGLSVAGLLVLLALGAWRFRRPTTEAPLELEIPRASPLRVTVPFLVSLSVLAAVTLLVDARGAQLTRIDLSAPVLGEGDTTEEASLSVLRGQARAGEASVDDYKERRKALSKARITSMVGRLLQSKPRR